MLKSELVLLEVLRGAKKQKEMAGRLGISLGTVNNALKPLRRMGAIQKKRFGLELVDREKALLYWASTRNLQKDVVYKTFSGRGVKETEKTIPSGAVFTAYTAFRIEFGETPADYSEVYVYADEETLKEIRKRFPEKNGPANLTVLAKPEKIEGRTAPPELVFVDLWNIKEWYAKEFLKALKQKMGLD